jgi:hypothetical protein
MATTTVYRPGETVPVSGIYGLYYGTTLYNEVTCVAGEPFPPSPRPGGYYRLIRQTH